MRFALFLDIDGVLNTRTTCQHTPDGYTGIDDQRVEILARAVKKYKTLDIILTSDWKELKEESEDYQYLLEKLRKYGLGISGKTVDHWSNRGEGILHYLREHPEIEDFVIVDDHEFDFSNYEKLWDRLLITNGIERAEYASEMPEVETIIFRDYIKQFS